MEQLAERFPFLFPAPLPHGERAIPPSRGKTDQKPLLEKLVRFLSGVTLAYYFHKIGHDEDLSAPVWEAIRRCSGAPARQLQEELLRLRPEAILELFNASPGAVGFRQKSLPDRFAEILGGPDRQEELAGFLSRHFRSEWIGFPAPAGDPENVSSARELGMDAIASHRLELKILGANRIPLFPFLAVGNDSRLYLFGGFDGRRARYCLLAGYAERETREISVRKCLAEYFLQMGRYADSRRIFDGLRISGPPGEHRGLWAAVYGSLGERFFRQGRFADAARILERALLHRPNIPKARFQLCETYRRLGRFREAEDALLQVVERYPTMPRAQALLKRTREDLRKRKAVPPYPPGRSGGGRREGVPATRPTDPLEGKREKRGRPSREPVPRGRRLSGEEFLLDMTGEAQRGRFQPLIGRETEIGEILNVLCCRDKRNPLLVGDAGVGKTALVEELARRLASGDAPEPLRGKRLFALNLAPLVAGAKYRGEFEERMLEILEDLKETDSLLFVDHFHTLVQPPMAKGGALDAGGLLKGPLVRGEIQVIGITSHEEVQNTIEKDPSLSRCFQRIPVREPRQEEAFRILQGVKGRYEEFHHVRFVDDALRGSLEAVQRYLPGGNLPDKALDVVDRAAARVALDVASGLRSDRLVTERDLLATIATMGGIPSSRVSEGFRQTLRELEPFLSERIIGQPEPIETVSRVLRSAGRGMKLVEDRPNGVFLFLGPTGVGKTELARAMAAALFGGPEGLIRIDMSEYMDRISTSRLIGASPGYVGYNDPNQLADKVRRRPYCLILLDEVEKADPQMMQLFLQVFDAGRLTDARGRTVSFGATTIVMTTNLGSELYTRSVVGYSHGEGSGMASRESLRKELMSRFSPEFLNRIDEYVFFRPLRQSDIRAIAELQLQGIREGLAKLGKQLIVEKDALDWVAARGYSPLWGARDLGRVLRREILDPLARISLFADWPQVERVVVDCSGESLRFSRFDSRRIIASSSLPPAPSFFSG